MRTKYFNFEVTALVVLTLVPWPGPSVFQISCPRDSASVVRKVVQTKWGPVLDKYQVKLPLECPFHPARDIFGPQQSAKHQHRPSQWTCGFCGKSFFEERHLDRHFDNRHKTNINMGEDAVCLADYCDIIRCEVLVTQESLYSSGDSETMTTDIEIWRETTAYRTALTPAGPRDLARVPVRASFPALPGTATPEHYHCSSSDAPPEAEDKDVTSPEDVERDGSDGSGFADDPEMESEDVENRTSPCDRHLVDSVLPPVDRKQQRAAELLRLKADCKPEELQKLRIKCEILIRDCIAGLLVHLSVEDFSEMEDELNRLVCWYLTCDRYWQDGPARPRAFPWGLLFVMVMVLSLGVCLCYYIIWVLFDSDDQSVASTSATATAHSSPAHGRGQNQYGEELYTVADLNELGQSEHYIYVTYPPELKRRLLESCYNRTTRL